MSLNYTTYLASISNLMAVGQTAPNFQTMVPNMIDDAEQRIYRSLDFLNTIVRTTATLSLGTRNLTLPSPNGTFVVLEEVNAIVPAGAIPGTRVPLLPTTKEVLNFLYPGLAGS